MRKQGKWSADDMKNAVEAVRTQQMSQKAAAKQFSVPRETLRRHLSNKNKFAKGGNKYHGRPTVLSPEMEQDLKNHILNMEKMLFGLTKTTVQRLAFQIALKNNVSDLKHFNVDKKIAGRYWFKEFLARNPELSLRTAEGTSIARASGFNKKSVDTFFDIYLSVFDKHSLTPNRIFNMDETSLSTVQKSEKIVSRKGKNQIGTITSAERGVSVTCVSCMSAAGSFLPPMLIYKRKRMTDRLKCGAPAGTAFEVQDKGWMDSEVFKKWLEHFISYVKPTIAQPVLIVMDGHSSHTNNLEAINLARESGVIMISLPPHCTHKMQPLDIGYFRPLKLYYNRAADTWMRANPGRALSVYEIPTLLNEAFQQASVVRNAVNAFQKAGLYPPNRYVFSDEDFMATSVAAECPRETEEPASGSPTQRDQNVPSSRRRTPEGTEEDSMPSTVAPDVDGVQERPKETPDSSQSVPDPGSSKPSSQDASSRRNHRVVQTTGDGRCFFRSVAIATDPKLQQTERDILGNPMCPAFSIMETMAADRIRASLVVHMAGQIETYSHLSPAVLNADLPPHLHCNSMIERLQLVSRNNACVGELEIIATAEMLHKAIIVINEAGETVQTYNNVYENQLSHTICLRFIAGDDAGYAGHYVAVVVCDGHGDYQENQNSPASVSQSCKELQTLSSNLPPETSTQCMEVDEEQTGPTSTQHQPSPNINAQASSVHAPHVRAEEILPFPRKSPKAQTRKRRCQVATELTSSPHKQHLETKAPKAKRSQKASANRPTSKKEKPQGDQEEDWTCLICQDNVKEAMTRCVACGKWAHDKCTNQANLNHYVCDFCV